MCSVCVYTLMLPTLQNMVVFLSVDAGNNIVRCRSISVGGAAGAGPGPSVQVGQHHGAPGAHLCWGWHPVEVAETESVLRDSWRCCPHAVCRKQVASHQLSSGTAWQLWVHFLPHLAVPQAGTDRVHCWPALVLRRVNTFQDAEFLERE